LKVKGGDMDRFKISYLELKGNGMVKLFRVNPRYGTPMVIISRDSLGAIWRK
jgi:hypothetical protein